MASARPGSDDMVMQTSSSNILLSFGFRVAIEAAILVFAVIAARRYKLKGLWLLVLATLLAVLRDGLTMGFSAWFHGGHDDATVYSTWLQYFPFVTMVIVLLGWFVLAFSRRVPAPR